MWDFIIVQVFFSFFLGFMWTFVALFFYTMAYKGFYGPGEIEPLRNIVLNHFHQFPYNYRWSELKLQAWAIYQNFGEVSNLPSPEKVNSFVSKQESAVDIIKDYEKVFKIVFDKDQLIHDNEKLAFENESLRKQIETKS